MIYYEWPGYCKMATIGDYHILLGPNADLMNTAEWWVTKNGRRPTIVGAYMVSEEFHDKYKELFETKGMYFDGDDTGSNEL